MKTIKIIIALLVFGMVYISCEQEEEAVPTKTDAFIIGNWTVSSFVKGSDDMTNDFENYTFSCTQHGGMTIQGNGNNYNCSWENMNNSDSIFNFQIMGCGQGSPLYECIDDWNLTSYDSLHCYFTTHNPEHHRSMSWERKN